MIKNVGAQSKSLASHDAARDPDRVNYVFAGGEFSIAAWVQRGLTDAGAVSNLDWAELRKEQPSFDRDLSVFQESLPIPRSVILAGPHLDPALADAITQLLLAMEKSRAGRQALEKYNKIQ